MKTTAEGGSKQPSKLYDLGRWAASSGAKSIKAFAVLTQELVSVEDRSTINLRLARLTPGQSAQAHAIALGFSSTPLDPHGRVVLLRWRGIEAALLFRRAVSEMPILPKEQLPPKILSRDDEAWTMLPLMQSAHHLDMQQLRERLANQEQELSEKRALLRHQQIELEAKDLHILDLEVKYTKLKQRRAAAKAKARAPAKAPAPTKRRPKKCAAGKPK